MILVSRYLVPKGFTGIAIFPFVLLRYESLKYNATFINHERIHLRQQLELLLLPFFVWYILEFLVRFLKHRQWAVAYRSISFEREAYSHESNEGFLKSRRLWNFLKFL
ncbi:hypothetical protein M0G43_00235 [Subsaxibacter sp. CAU 1640]|uniref:hypothetical protein n=1 Tax=Subsaxibacter sp. CAU 1640 TaxID=2933271 RepID=UPI002003C2BF|nr:hypothetical protein [Subsaxibacter sp. CAU 1640]MCK7588991.1 hypothetical protein [Subsaxibacter sp. CAU 1640]